MNTTNKIYEYRKKNNLTQADFAFDLTRAGLHCTKSDISRWERGLCIPSADARFIIADVIGMSDYDLLVDIIANLDYLNYRNKAVKKKARGASNVNTG